MKKNVERSEPFVPSKQNSGVFRSTSLLMLLVSAALIIGLLIFTRPWDVRQDTGPKSGMLRAGTPILFITIDTLREDHMGRSGYKRDTTPFLDRLAAEGIYFSRCFSQSSWTLPAMLSMFSSLSPPVFGVKNGVAPIPKPVLGSNKSVKSLLNKERKRKVFPYSKVEVFADAHVTLPEVLREKGYKTVGISTNGHLIQRQGFPQGFDVFNEADCMWGKADSALSQALKTMEGVPSDYLFLWIHLMDPHFDKHQVGTVPTYLPQPGYENLFDTEPDASEVDKVIANYDRKVRYTDEQLARFFETLEAKKLLDHFLVIVAVDHGEEFMEKGRWGHGNALTNTLIHVPLIIRLPGREGAGRVVDDMVRNLDIMPTVLDLLGIPSPSGAEGISLRRSWEGEGLPPLPVYSETQRGKKNLRCLIHPELDCKLVQDLDSGMEKIYSLSSDYLELKDLSQDLAGKAERMKKQLATLVHDMEKRAIIESATHEIPEDEIRRLEALGYVSRPKEEKDK